MSMDENADNPASPEANASPLVPAAAASSMSPDAIIASPNALPALNHLLAIAYRGVSSIGDGNAFLTPLEVEMFGQENNYGGGSGMLLRY